jgi:hypothetical protein
MQNETEAHDTAYDSPTLPGMGGVAFQEDPSHTSPKEGTSLPAMAMHQRGLMHDTRLSGTPGFKVGAAIGVQRLPSHMISIEPRRP